MIKNLQNDKELTNSEDNKAEKFCGKKNGSNIWHQWFTKKDMKITLEHLKKISNPFILKEMQIKTSLRCYFFPFTCQEFEKFDNTLCCQGSGEADTLLCCWSECKMEQPLWRGTDNIKPNYILIYLRLSSFSLRICPEAQLPSISNYTYTRLFLAALFVIAKY